MSKKQAVLSLSDRGRCFLALLHQAVKKTEVKGIKEVEDLFGAWGFDEGSIGSLCATKRVRNAEALLSTMKSSSLSDFFLMVNKVQGIQIDSPLSGMLAEILKESILTYPGDEESDSIESVSDIHVFSFDRIEDRLYFESLADAGQHAFSEAQKDHVHELMVDRFKTFFARTLRACVRPDKRLIVVHGENICYENDKDGAYAGLVKEQVHLALQEVIVKLGALQKPRCEAVLYCSDVSFVKADNLPVNYVCNPDEVQVFLAKNKKKHTQVILKASLARGDEGQKFAKTSGSKAATKRLDEKRAPYFIANAGKYLDKVKVLIEKNTERQVRLAKEGGQKAVEQDEWRVMLKEDKQEKLKVLLPVAIVPIVLGLTIGLVLGSQGIPAISALPVVFSVMGSLGFSAVAGVVTGVVVASILLIIAASVLCCKKKLRSKQTRATTVFGVVKSVADHSDNSNGAALLSASAEHPTVGGRRK